MKKIKRFNLTTLLVLAFTLLMVTSCEDAFIDDGDSDNGINSNANYLYVIDNDAKELLMLDKNLNTLKTWDLSGVSEGYDIRGLTCNDDFLWISVTGSLDQIIQLAADGDDLLVLSSMDAPPSKQGTIRDLTWDGEYLWALNSGSTTYNFPAKLFKIDVNTNTVLEEYDLNLSEARGITYVKDNEDVYGRGTPDGIYITETGQDKIYLFDESRVLSEYFDMPLHPRGESYTAPYAISYSNKSFYVVNVSGSSGNYLYRIQQKGTTAEAVVEDLIEFPFNSPYAIQWSNFDFREGVDPEISSVLPNSAKLGETLDVDIEGIAFTSDLEVSFGDDITVNQKTYVDSKLIRVNITVSNHADVGTFDVVLTNGDGNTFTGTSMFNVIERDPNDGYIYYCDNDGGKIIKLKISDLSVVEEWNPTYGDGGSFQGLEFLDDELWFASAGSCDSIMKIDTATMTVLQTMIAPPAQSGTIREIAFDSNGDLWALNSSEDAIYKLNKTDGSILETIATAEGDGGDRGIVFVEGVLYSVNYKTDKAYTYNFTTSTWAEAFDIPAPAGVPDNRIYPTGITYDGVNFWIANSSYEYDYIMQVSTSGALIQSYTVLNAGDASIAGVAFTY